MGWAGVGSAVKEAGMEGEGRAAVCWLFWELGGGQCVEVVASMCVVGGA